MTLSDTINAYYMPLYSPDPAVIEYYAEIFEGINCLQDSLGRRGSGFLPLQRREERAPL